MSSSNRRRRQLPMRPYGFCCPPETHYDNQSRRYQPLPIKTSLPSLCSLHECPALRIRHHVIEHRPKDLSKDGAKGGTNSAMKLSLQSVHEKGGKTMLDATESFIEAMRDIERAQRQAEYERMMDIWADLGKKNVELEKLKWEKCDRPCWYADYSLSQLKNLKELEHTMFLDKEEKTTNRTLHSLHSMGMITEMAKVKSRVIRKLIDQFSTEPIKFLYELYKAVTGHYFEDHKRNNYECNERIIISGIVFLELPKIIVELHKRLPPVITFEFPPRPTPQTLKIARKMSSPLVEKLYLPVHWRRYDFEMIQWRRKCLTILRPLVVLPKETKKAEDNKDKFDDKFVSKEVKENNNVIGDSADVKNNKTDKNRETVEDNKKSAITQIPNHTDNVAAAQHANKNKKLESDKQETAVIADHIDNRDDNLFQAQTINWTTPPTPCPYKYQKLLKQTGPLDTDEEFFNELKPIDQLKTFIQGRENLSFKLQHYLLDVEADFYKLTNEADKITGEVSKIAREVFDPEPKCDACCSCRQTKRSHALWHATKHPYQLIDGVTADGDCPGIDDNTQIVGTLAMHSPAASQPCVNEPPRVPSCDKFVKDKVITGATTTLDGDVVHEVAGVTKTIKHVPERILRPDVDVIEVKNVPPCACADDKSESIDCDKLDDQNDDSCYAKTFRPNEGPAHTCKDFDKNDGMCGCGDEIDICGNGDDECGCGNDLDKCMEDSGEEKEEKKDCECPCEESRISKAVDKVREEVCKVCKWCGMAVDVKCVDKNIRILAKTTKKLKPKCSCGSLSEFLQLDLTKNKCSKLEAEKTDGKHGSKDKKSKSSCHSRKYSRKPSKGEARVKRLSSKLKKNGEKPKVIKTCLIKNENNEIIEDGEKSVDESTEGGPYGLRTASEQALTTEYTVAYLVKKHPPNFPTEQIPVREGGRPCKCRENRNNRKTLLYGIAGTTTGDEAERVIDGVTWLTPIPSLRNSKEYIPEYELHDSPYEKHICNTMKKSDKGVKRTDIKIISDEGNDQERDWDNAFNDDYLTEFFTKSRDNIPCYEQKAKDIDENKEPRQLKVMQPVCECKYERKIVKRDEERKKWADRQKRLKALKKESFLHITELAGNNKDVAKGCDNTPVMVISGITLQTPHATPSQSGVRSNLPFSPLVFGEAETVQKELVVKDTMVDRKKIKQDNKKTQLDNKKIQQDASSKKRRISKSDSEKNVIDEKNKRSSAVSDKSAVVDIVETAGNDMKCKKSEGKSELESVVSQTISTKMERRVSCYDDQELELMMQLQHELGNMRNDFLTTKLPHFYKLPQFSYWISYRVKGMHFTKKYKMELLERSLKLWKALDTKPREPVCPEPVRVKRKERHTLNFDRACYWKRKIARNKLQYYTKLRQYVVSIGRDNWRFMEFGKFPHLLFKQAYFTYMPATEKDTYVIKPFV